MPEIPIVTARLLPPRPGLLRRGMGWAGSVSCVGGAALCVGRCSAASLAPSHKMPVALSREW